MLWCLVAFLALAATAQGRAVNISNTWVLPEEGFPVFYRYFRDRISWYEADAVCQFHHANLVTVDTTAQYDAVRAYLKELDISSAVWVGLIRSNPDGDFTWTDYRGLSGDGYWSAAPDARTAPLCAAADPAADYRWEARACGGPTVASFICELPVPQWALGNEGCMVRALPALTILYLPESAAVQLTADCGLAGVKRVECTGNVKREDLLKNLKCSDEEEIMTTQSLSSVTSTWVGTTGAVFTDQDTTTEITTDDHFTTEHEDDINQSTTSPINYDLNAVMKYKLPNKVLSGKRFNKIDNNDLSIIHYNNLQSNYIPKLANDNHLTNEQLEKIEDEKHMLYKMLHEEIAKLGNLENIFTQPTDHFVPPLVMAKAKISDDMIVLSLQEKHAQQLAEKHNIKTINNKNDHNDHIDSTLQNSKLKSVKEESKKVITDEPLVVSMQPTKLGEILKKDKNKSSIPKKYIEKFYEPKSKIWKTGESKATQEKVETSFTQTENATKESTTAANIVENYKYDDNSSIDLTIILNDTPKKSNELAFVTNYTNHVSKLEVIKSNSFSNDTDIKLIDIGATEEPIMTSVETLHNTINNINSTLEVFNITTYSEDYISSTPIVSDITTKLDVPEEKLSTSNKRSKVHVNNNNEDVFSTHINVETADNYYITTPSIIIYDTTTAVRQEDNNTANVTTKSSVQMPMITNELIISTTVENSNIKSEQNQQNFKETFTSVRPFSSTASKNITREDIETTTFKDIESVSILSTRTEYPNENSSNTNSSEIIDDFQSPLLSGANEPLHRPNRSRRPQTPPNRNKFNPFRILG